MDAHPVARSAAASERTTAMAEMCRCIGSARFAIEAHDAPIEDFPKQPSRKDGLGRMCKTHWNQYTAGLARDAKARKTAESVTTVTEDLGASVAAPAVTEEPAPPERSPKRRRSKPAPVAEGDEATS
jgi:hypothetical protein